MPFVNLMIFSRSLGTSMIFFFYKMTPVLLQGAVWGYAALCDSSSFSFFLSVVLVSSLVSPPSNGYLYTIAENS